MNALIELIKKIGIFMIAAQAVIHFAPGQKYEKYMKLIVGIMILLQFLAPVYKILEGTEADWSTRLSNMEQELQTDGFAVEFQESGSAAEAMIKSIEEEIKSKLNNELSGEAYMVISVSVKLEDMDVKKGTGENNNSQYALDTVRVAVRAYTRENNAEESDMDDNTDGSDRIEKIEKIQIQQVTLGESSVAKTEQNELLTDSEQEIADDLRKRFSTVLGIEEKYMEVSVYGTSEETDG